MPPLAASNHPARDCEAPVNAPLSWPNSSASIRLSLKAPQFTATKGPVRPLTAWMCRAMSSLPVPVSPVTSTVASLWAMRSTSNSSLSDAGS